MLYWGIKFPKGRSYEDTIGLIEFPQDQIVFYKGLYGIPSYIVWYIASDKKSDWLSSGDIFEFFVFNAPRKKSGDIWSYSKPHIVDTMVVINIIFDVEIQMFKLTAVSHFWYILANTKMLTAIDVGTQDSPVSGIEVIKKLVNIANKDQYMEADIDGSGAIPKIKYISINEDPEISVLDKITDICLENAWEWYIGKGNIQGKRYNVIYIGNKLKIDRGYVFPFEPEEGHRQIIETSLFTTITTESVWCKPMLSYGEPSCGRAIWVKFFLGNEGGLMTVMIQRISFNEETGLGTIKFLSENEFIETLNTGLAKEYGIQRLFKYPLRNYPILIGKMFGEVTDQHIKEYSAPEWSGDAKINNRNINKKIFETEFTDRRPQHYLKDRKITTPFAGDGVGLLLPQVDGYKTLLAPDGERDSALIGPGYFGPKDKIPVRDSEKDFRLQLPGAVLYVKENGEIIIEQNSDGSVIPTGSGKYIKIHTDGTIDIDTNGTINIGVNATLVKLAGGGYKLSHYNHVHGYKHIHEVGNMGIPIPTMQHIGFGMNTDMHIAGQGTTKTEAD